MRKAADCVGSIKNVPPASCFPFHHHSPRTPVPLLSSPVHDFPTQARLTRAAAISPSKSTAVDRNPHSFRSHQEAHTYRCPFFTLATMQFVRILSLASLVALSSLVASVTAQAENDNPNGKVLYVSDPHCNSYQCRIHWKRNHTYFVNWINPPKGEKLSVKLIPETDQSLPTYTLAASVSAHAGKDKCDSAGTGKKCGRIDWTVPDDAKAGEYSIVVESLKTHKQGYTDVVRIGKKQSSNTSGNGKKHHRRSESSKRGVSVVEFAESESS
ncbi:hypothetical protein IE81DRAFT_310858 [Ceraceosorus guamensis]|uniref:Uncharacterized protein n=1 Tax=Ceraceosorus guamensis TaxID=1522189 RepID=A0A316W3Q1_9BASI|nr:hypothetical protein IE81DRAFT_310858 [Ceraceosorus guamensis]PWN44322.1 hypothetical protein IE81DRAFT_310858 [Ceraceosorus guamensis]